MRLIDAAPPGWRIGLVRAGNPSPMTLSGTNSWLIERAGEVWVLDPGPDDAGHITALAEGAAALGQPAGVLLSHDHLDHSAGLDAMAAALGGVPILRFGDDFTRLPLVATHTPGHAADHLVFHAGEGDDRVLFSGDLILGQSSTIVPPGGGTLIAYLDSLKAVAELAPALILPGHGEPIEDGAAAATAQREHRLARERQLLAALQERLYEREALLDRVWSDVGPELRIAAHVTMQSHLEKLDLEGRLPVDFEVEGRKSWQHRAT